MLRGAKKEIYKNRGRFWASAAACTSGGELVVSMISSRTKRNFVTQGDSL